MKVYIIKKITEDYKVCNNRIKAAKILGISPSTLYRKIRKNGDSCIIGNYHVIYINENENV